MRRITPGAVRLAIVVTAILAWELLPRLGLIPALFLPPLSQTVYVLVANWREYGTALLITLGEVGIGILFACGGGVLAGALVGGVPALRNFLLPVCSSLFAIPVVVLYPMLTVWVGIGPDSKIAFASIYGFFPTLLATAAGARNIEPRLLMTARSMGATPLQQVLRVVLPASIPTVLAGLRLGGALVIVGVVVSEMLTSTAGIGYLVTRYRTILDSPHVFAAVLLVVALTLAFDRLMRLIEGLTAAWRFAGRERERPSVSAPAVT